jgi:hypothetical protein
MLASGLQEYYEPLSDSPYPQPCLRNNGKFRVPLRSIHEFMCNRPNEQEIYTLKSALANSSWIPQPHQRGSTSHSIPYRQLKTFHWLA